MPRLSQDTWAAARNKWESDPALTFEALGKELGVSHTAGSQRARKDGWARDPALHDVARRAQFKADAREAAKVARELSGETGRVRALAEEIRADVIERHRADWAEHRQHFATADIAADFDLGRGAKISAEMLAIRQKGERAAYGLDEASTAQAPQGPDWTALVRTKADEV